MAATEPAPDKEIPVIERNPMWAPIAPDAKPVAAPMYAQVVDAYRAAPAPVRFARSQRYSLVVTEPLPAMVQQ